MNTVKKHGAHGFSQFKLTQNLLNNLSQFDLTSNEKLVLLYLSSCYNPKKADMFPKQKTIAAKIGISERSVVRAIQGLIKQGLIVVECKYTNHYKFTSKIVGKCPQNDFNSQDDNLSAELGQNDTQQGDNLSPHEHEPIKEHTKQPASVEDFKILKDYAESKGAKNITAYINALKQSGSAEKIIKEFKVKRGADRFYENQYRETLERNEAVRNFEGIDPKSHKGMQEVLKQLRG